jgi:hypothetical protein
MTDELAPSDPLTKIGMYYGTDKAEGHWYTPHYHRRFEELRAEPITLLEIGVGGYDDPDKGGESLRMWRHYFTSSDAKIYGIDIHPKAMDLGPGVETFTVDASNPGQLRELGEKYGPFDIVIDDGSHIPNDVMQAWVVLWDYLKSPGWYVIEDLQTSYWKPFGGSSERTGDTVIGFLQGLIDRIHYAEFDIPGYNPNRFDLSVVGMEIARNIVFIRKGDNSKPSEYMPPHPHGIVFDEDVKPMVG